MRYAAAATALALGAGLACPAALADPPQLPAPASQSAPDPAASPDPQQPGESEAAPSAYRHASGDPLEHFNRSVFAVNEAVDKAVVEPLARGYRAATPAFFRAGVRNFLNNLRSPVLFANDVLQGSPKRAGATAGRFVINSTVGAAGLIDVAADAGLKGHDTDFGVTLGKWGAKPGAYLMLPLLGPSDVRDGIGELVDIAMDPITYAQFSNAGGAKALRFGLDELTKRTDLLDEVDSMRATSIDPYATTRSGFEQARRTAVEGGEAHAEDSPESSDTLSE